MNPPAVKLDDLTDVLDFNSAEMGAWLDRETGRVVIVDGETIRAVESADEDEDEEQWTELRDWQDKQVPIARAILKDDPRYLVLPDECEFHEYSHMERFIGTVADNDHAEQLWRSIKGKGAFRRFKDTAHRLNQIDAWYRYRDEAMKSFMLDWRKPMGSRSIKARDGGNRPDRLKRQTYGPSVPPYNLAFVIAMEGGSRDCHDLRIASWM